MSRYVRLVLPVSLLIFADCGSSTGPGGSLTGRWRTGFPTSYIDLSLRTGVLNVDGTGAQYIESSFFDSITVTGHWNPDRTFHLNLTFHASTSATYDGEFLEADVLDGTLARNGQAEPHVVFYRQPQ